MSVTNVTFAIFEIHSLIATKRKENGEPHKVQCSQETNSEKKKNDLMAQTVALFHAKEEDPNTGKPFSNLFQCENSVNLYLTITINEKENR